MERNNLTVRAEVLEQMAVMAANEVEGVSVSPMKVTDIKGILGKGKPFKSAVATEKNGAISVDVYIKLSDTVQAKTAAEAVQKNVKEKLQSMTGSAITQVNVYVADVTFDE